MVMSLDGFATSPEGPINGGSSASATQLVMEGMEAGGPARAFERFLRFAAGDPNWERLEPGVQKGMLASADTYHRDHWTAP